MSRVEAGLVLSLACLFACSSDPEEGLDVMIFDAGTSADLDASDDDASFDTGIDAGHDGGDDVGPPDSGDSGVGDATAIDADDSGTDGGPADADLDGAIDSGDDAAIDSGVDAGDVGFDAGGPGPLPSGYVGAPIDETGSGGQNVTIVDIEGDTDLDVLVSFNVTDTVRLYLNDGAAVFTPIDLPTPGTITAMAQTVDDFDDDGDLDVAAVGFFTRAQGFNTPGDVVWYQSPGDPSGTWATMPIALGSLYGLDTIASGDLTGDGLPDLVVGCDEAYDTMGMVVGYGVYSVANTGSGSFGTLTPIDEFLGGVEVVMITDVDLDGVPDVVASSRNDSELVWFENLRAVGTIEPVATFARHTIANPNLPTAIAFGQLDGDPALELVSMEDDAMGGRLVWYDPPADPTQPWTLSEIDATFGGHAEMIRAVTVDLNQDGYSDVAVASAVHGQLRAYIQGAAGAWTLQTIEPAAPMIGGIAAGDLDGDRFPDLVTSTNLSGPVPMLDRIVWWRTQP
jgi:hypothetical protein